MSDPAPLLVLCACGCGMPRCWCDGRDNALGEIRISYVLPMPDGTAKTYHARCAYPMDWFQKNGVTLTAESLEKQVVYGVGKKVQAILEQWHNDGGVV